MKHTPETLELHRAMIDIGVGDKSADVVAALALTLAYAIKYNSTPEVRAEPKAAVVNFIGLVLLELRDPDSQMEKPT